MKIRQKKLFEKKIIGEFWEKILKIFEKMVKEIHLYINIFEKIAKEIHLFSKNQKIVKKRWSLQKSQKSLKKDFKK